MSTGVISGKRAVESWPLILVGELPVGFVQAALDSGLASSMVRSEPERAVGLLRRNQGAVFALPAAWGEERILAFARGLGRTWRRGLLVGELDNELGIKALNSHVFAYYITLPLCRADFVQAAECLRHWQSQAYTGRSILPRVMGPPGRGDAPAREQKVERGRMK